MCEIVRLVRKRYDGYEYPLDYESELYYDVRIHDTDGGISVDFTLMPFPRPFVKNIRVKLFDQISDAPEAYGIFKDGALIALMELSPVYWNNRLRILGMWVDKAHRGQGHGKLLMDKAKALAREKKRRSIVLETQTSNSNAIAFFLSQGFTLAGFDAYAYTNEDVEKKEVRFEMHWRPARAIPGGDWEP